MKSLAVLLAGGMFAVPAVLAQEQEPPVLEGYVTRVASNSDFDVNGYHVLCGADTVNHLHSSSGETLSYNGCPQDTLYLGKPMKIYGSLKQRKLFVQATRIEATPVLVATVRGSAVIEALVPQRAPSAKPDSLLLRADGYQIQITKETKISLTRSVSTLAALKAGDWIDYEGRQDATGLVTATSAVIGQNVPTKAEARTSVGEEYDPSTVPPDAKQKKINKVFRIYDPKKFPPFRDPAMQARIERIGNSLIPAFQRALPDNDPAKVNFRFQLIDTELFAGAFPLQSGIILIPHQTVEHMQNDSQIASIIGESIAYILEYQAFRMRWSAPETAVEAFVAFGPLGAAVAGAATESEVERRR